MKIYGIDFTSAPCRRKPLTVVEGLFQGDRLVVATVRCMTSFGEFEDLLRSPGPWIAGMDFPFGQPRKLIDDLGWPATWEGYVGRLAGQGVGEFCRELDDYKSVRAYGDKQHRRKTDLLAKSVSPQNTQRPPVGRMFFQGAPRLLASGVNIIPCRPTPDDRVVVEAYPALVAEALGSRTGYKGEENTDAVVKRSIRAAMIQVLNSTAFQARYGFPVDLPTGLGTTLIDDASGDQLDAVLCAIQAAWAWARRDQGYGVPADCDPAEGWIIDPATFHNPSSWG